MTYSQFSKGHEKTRYMLRNFHKEFSMISWGNNAKCESDFSKPLIRWVSGIFKKQCGIGIGEKFRTHTLFSLINVSAPKQPFITYFRIDRFRKHESTIPGVESPITYRLFLCTSNVNSDTDMGDDSLMYIEFETDGKHFNGYSFHFDS